MGYSTDFEGKIDITPPLTPKQVLAVNTFCETRHGGNTREDPGCPSFWCDYVVSDDGASIEWNGSEKSYAMDKWMRILVDKFFARYGVMLNGTLDAQGEDPNDSWKLSVTNNLVVRHTLI